jgi:tetratricopeptide (TPR) repeat protein
MPIYDAFISYSHAKDKPIATALQSVVQRLGKPWYRRRALRLFRDDTTLTATPHLWPTIARALHESRYFILLASPESAKSKWVNQEVTHWLAHRSIDTLLIGVTAGNLAWDEVTGDFPRSEDVPLPPALIGKFPDEPKWVDLRQFRDDADSRSRRLIELAADFAAIVHGMPKEDLLSEEVRQQRRTLTLAWSAVGSLLVLAGLASWQWREATVQRREAVEQQRRAEQTLAVATQTANDLTSDLALRFRNSIGVPASLVKDILDRAQRLQRQLTATAHVTPDLRHGEASALVVSADTLSAIGDPDAAMAAVERARAIFEDLLRTDPERKEWQLGLSIAYNRMGLLLYRKDRYAAALDAYGKDFAILKKLTESDPDRAEWQHELALNYEGVGDVLAAQGKLKEAFDAFAKNLEISSRLAEREPDKVDWQRDLAGAYERIGVMFGGVGGFDQALGAFVKSLVTRQKLAERDPGSARAQRDVAIIYDRIALVYTYQKKPADALEFERKGLAITTRLATSDPGNVEWQQGLSVTHVRIGGSLAALGRFDEAAASYDQAIASNARNANAYNGRCLMRAALDRLKDALADCNESLRLRPDAAEALDSRGLTYLKLGQLDEAIADYDAALRLKPKFAPSHYGRGLAKTKKGDAPGGNADIAAARALQPGIAEELARYGIR